MRILLCLVSLPQHTDKVLTKTAISLEPLDLHLFNTPQIEALYLRDLKNTSGGLFSESKNGTAMRQQGLLL